MSHKTKAELEEQIGALRLRLNERDETIRKTDRRLGAEERRREELQDELSALNADRIALADLVRHMGETIRLVAERRRSLAKEWSVVASRTYEEQP